MKTKGSYLLCVLALGVLPALPSAVLGGVAIELETIDHLPQPPQHMQPRGPMGYSLPPQKSGDSSGVPETSATLQPRKGKMKILVDGQNVKIVSEETGKMHGPTVIYRGARREVVMVDHEQQSYMVMDSNTVKALAEKMKAMNERMSQMMDPAQMERMKQALQSVPEDKRAMVEEMMKKRMPPAGPPADQPPLEVKKVKDGEEVNGRPCTQYTVSRGEQKIRELWVTDWKQLEGGSEAVKAFEGMAEFFDEMQAALAQGGQPFPMKSQMGDSMFAQIRKLQGFPVAAKEYQANGTLEKESRLSSAKKQKVDPSEFNPPPHYRQRQMLQP